MITTVDDVGWETMSRKNKAMEFAFVLFLAGADPALLVDADEKVWTDTVRVVNEFRRKDGRPTTHTPSTATKLLTVDYLRWMRELADSRS